MRAALCIPPRNPAKANRKTGPACNGQASPAGAAAELRAFRDALREALGLRPMRD